MRLLFLSILCCQLFYITLTELGKCSELTEQCYSTNYYSYVECVRRRHKRSLQSDDCNHNCNDCDCNSCNYNECQQSTCNECCNTCCSNYIPCSTNHCCHKTCHAQCSTSTCRSSCRQKCFNSVKEKTINGNHHSNSSFDSSNKHNVTTIIHLNNVINNTNIIDVPINLNTSNVQNVTLAQQLDNINSSSGQKCCTVIGPRQCVTDPYPRCFHLRSNQCGPFCTSSIVHKEQQQFCESIYPGAPPDCKQHTTYIPQPHPKCITQTEWPYVRCGVQKSAACAGCYRHYVDQNSTSYLRCPMQCYDDGFGMGPLYRQGPIYRPTFSHIPCCWNSGYPFSGSYSSPYGGGYGTPFGGGYDSPYGGGYGSTYGGSFGNSYDYGYPSAVFGYPPGGLGQFPPGLTDTVESRYLNLYNSNRSSKTFDPEINVGPDVYLSIPPQPERLSREVEIKVEYQTPLPAQAQVEIKYDDHNNHTASSDKMEYSLIKKGNATNNKLKHKLP